MVDSTGAEVEVPLNPQRVVALSERDMDAAFALGVPLVGVVNGRGAQTPPAYLQSYLGDAVSVGAFSEPSPEAILNLNPDLILIGGMFPELEAMLPSFREIAPVFVTFNSGDDWRLAFQNAAYGLNRTAEAEAWLADYDARAADLAGKLPAGDEVTIVRFNPDGPVIMAPASFASTIVTSLGLTRPEGQMSIEGQGHGDTVSLEAISAIDAGMPRWPIRSMARCRRCRTTPSPSSTARCGRRSAARWRRRSSSTTWPRRSEHSSQSLT
ncbi:MAG: hypothetical protein DCC51_09085 [Anaerolineae bacterium]|nr:MAG: hypothetical protein DCC51_09085 [Anaerolineae bacterium]